MALLLLGGASFSCLEPPGSGSGSGVAARPGVLITDSDGNAILDQGFGRNGILKVGSFVEIEDRALDLALDLALDAEGRLLLAGRRWDPAAGARAMTLLRFGPDGSPDQKFAKDGAFQDADDETWRVKKPARIALDSQARILIVGSMKLSALPQTEQAAVWRLLSTGEPDLGFGDQGRVVLPGSPEDEYLDQRSRSVAIAGDGRIWVAGESHTLFDAHMLIWRLAPDGSLDPSFGRGGVFIHDSHSFSTAATSVLDGQGRLIVIGSVEDTFPPHLAIWRFLPEGLPDPSFGENGLQVHADVAGRAQFGRAAAVDASGRLVVAGMLATTHPDFLLSFGLDRIPIFDLAVWRLHEDGTLDPSFGKNGRVEVNIVSTTDRRDPHYLDNLDDALDLAIDEKGRILVCGFTVEPNLDFGLYNLNGWPLPVIWRFRPDGGLDPDFNGSGQAVFFDRDDTLKGAGPEDIRVSMALDAGGGIWMAVVGVSVRSWPPEEAGNASFLRVPNREVQLPVVVGVAAAEGLLQDQDHSGAGEVELGALRVLGHVPDERPPGYPAAGARLHGVRDAGAGKEEFGVGGAEVD